MHSALYTGSLRHRRRAPRAHAFSYPLFMVLLDLAELSTVFRGRWLWGVERRALASFRRADHLGGEAGDAARPLDTCVRELVEQQCGRRPAGPIRLLTHLRYFGYGFNPVSFYYCFDASDAEVVAVVAEVNNTPWGERQCYVLDAAQVGAGATGAAAVRSWHTAKHMHVSPFMPMDLQYEWRLSAPGQALAVHMRCARAGELQFDATLSLRRRAITGATLAGTLLRFPWMTARVIVAIHWQALRLWLKGVPVHDHPAGNAGHATGHDSAPRALQRVK